MPHSLYLHIPFCEHRCAYCDFNTYAGQGESLPAYVEALCGEVAFVGSRAPERIQVHTIFFGGGTPSLLSPEQFASIIHAIEADFDLQAGAEITMEANPGTVSPGDLGRLRLLGINRISFGVQSANAEELRMLERNHNFFDVIEAVSSARKAGFDNLNLDLIYGLPEQSLQTWQTTVSRILDLRPDHISAYALTLEHGTPFGRWAARGLLPTSDPDRAADMYEWASEALEAAGYYQYEISNWATDTGRLAADGRLRSARPDPPSRACLHNLQYWRGLPYVGLGAGAHGYSHHYRYSNVLRIGTYIDRLREVVHTGYGNRRGSESDQSVKNDARLLNLEFPLSPAAVNHHRQSLDEDMAEFMLTGLRLTREGVGTSVFEQRFRRDLKAVYANEIDELTRLRLLEWVKTSTSGVNETPEVLRLTKRGRLLGNQAFIRFVQ